MSSCIHVYGKEAFLDHGAHLKGTVFWTLCTGCLLCQDYTKCFMCMIPSPLPDKKVTGEVRGILCS